MAILLAFGPFLVYFITARFFPIPLALAAAALVSALLVLRHAFGRKSLKILDVGSLLLFAGLAGFAYLAHASWSVAGVRLRVDSGLLAIVLTSIVIRQPFTLQYAREQVSQVYWSSEPFLRVNYTITAVWALAFAVMAATDLAMLIHPQLSSIMAVLVTVSAMVGAIAFTAWYPQRVRALARR
jgi:hypothetical protein